MIIREMEINRIIALTFAAWLIMTSVLGCNMLKGAGQDIENAGEGIQRL